VASPELFRLVPARVQVEVAGQLTTGMTVTGFELPGELEDGNALVAMDIDVEKFWEVTLETYTRVAASLSGG